MLINNKDIASRILKQLKEEKPELWLKTKTTDIERLLVKFNNTIKKILYAGGFITLHTHWNAKEGDYIRFIHIRKHIRKSKFTQLVKYHRWKRWYASQHPEIHQDTP